ncbi:MAG: nitroreductase family protein, partial [Butyricimonas faecihominis]
MKRNEKSQASERSLIFYRYAGIIAVLIILGGSFYLFKDKRNEEVLPVVTQKIHPGGLKAILTCPDGTTVDISDTTYLAFVEKGKLNVSSTEEEVTTREDQEHFHTITIPRGGEYALTLSDGSRLRMNSESEIRIPAHFNVNSRDVYMQEKLGYFGERLILEAVERNMGTCWVGGTFAKDALKPYVKEDEKLYCVIAIGYTAHKKT